LIWSFVSDQVGQELERSIARAEVERGRRRLGEMRDEKRLFALSGGTDTPKHTQ
jgi:hypothetical protein